MSPLKWFASAATISLAKAFSLPPLALAASDNVGAAALPNNGHLFVSLTLSGGRSPVKKLFKSTTSGFCPVAVQSPPPPGFYLASFFQCPDEYPSSPLPA